MESLPIPLSLFDWGLVGGIKLRELTRGRMRLKATMGFEPMYTVLQTAT